MRSFLELERWYRASRFVLTLRVCFFIFSRSAASRACSSQLTCFPICFVAPRLFVLRYSCFTSRWDSSPCNWVQSSVILLESMVTWRIPYQLRWVWVRTSEHLDCMHIVTKKMKFRCWKVQRFDVPGHCRGHGGFRLCSGRHYVVMWYIGFTSSQQSWWATTSALGWIRHTSWNHYALPIPISCCCFSREFDCLELAAGFVPELSHEISKFFGEWL